jgi:hypothetical protein
MSGLVTSDYQWEFDGFLMGAGTAYHYASSNGFLDMAGVRANYTNRARSHGSFTEPQFAEGAVYDLAVTSVAADAATLAATVAALQGATYPQQSTRPLWFQLPGHPLLMMNVQCLRRSIPVDKLLMLGLVVKAALQFYAPDPLKYGPPVTVSTATTYTSGGLPFPMSFPLAFGAPAIGRVTTSNPGSAPVSPVFTVTGPVDAAGFQISSIEDGVVLVFNGSLGSGDSLVIDTRTGAVILNGSADRRALLAYTGVWPAIPAAVGGTPGVRTFQFSLPGAWSALASMSVQYSPAYW